MSQTRLNWEMAVSGYLLLSYSELEPSLVLKPPVLSCRTLYSRVNMRQLLRIIMLLVSRLGRLVTASSFAGLVHVAEEGFRRK